MESNCRNSVTLLHTRSCPGHQTLLREEDGLKMLLSIYIRIVKLPLKSWLKPSAKLISGRVEELQSSWEVQLNHRRHRLTVCYRPIFNIIWVLPQYTAPTIHNGTVAKLQSSANWTPYRIKHNPNNPKIPEIPVNSSNPKSHRNPNNSRNPNNLSNHNEDHHQEAAPPPAVHHLEEELDRLTGKIVSFKRLFLNSEKIWGIRVFSNVVQSLPINSEFPI